MTVTSLRAPDSTVLVSIGSGLVVISALLQGLAQRSLQARNYTGTSLLYRAGSASALVAAVMLAIWLVTKLCQQNLMPAKDQGARVLIVGAGASVASFLLTLPMAAIGSLQSPGAALVWGIAQGVLGVIWDVGLILVALGLVALLIGPSRQATPPPGAWPQYGYGRQVDPGADPLAAPYPGQPTWPQAPIDGEQPRGY